MSTGGGEDVGVDCVALVAEDDVISDIEYYDVRRQIKQLPLSYQGSVD